MKKFKLQSSFTNGVLDSRMASRLDIKQYYQGVEVGQNIRFTPQGGFARRGSMIITHEDYPVRILERGATDADFTIADITIVEYPQHDFNDASSPTPVSEIQEINFGDNYSDGDTYILTLDGIDTDPIAFLEDANPAEVTDHENRIQAALIDLPNTGNDGVTVAHDGASRNGAIRRRLEFNKGLSSHSYFL